jgi:hypothetical protein
MNLHTLPARLWTPHTAEDLVAARQIRLRRGEGHYVAGLEQIAMRNGDKFDFEIMQTIMRYGDFESAALRHAVRAGIPAP